MTALQGLTVWEVLHGLQENDRKLPTVSKAMPASVTKKLKGPNQSGRPFSAFMNSGLRVIMIHDAKQSNATKAEDRNNRLLPI